MISVRSRILQWTTAVSVSLFVAGGVLAQAPPAPAGAKAAGEAQTGQAAQPGAKRQKGKKGQRGRQSPLVQALASLSLTTEQKAKITPLTDKFREETRGATLTPGDRREKTQQLLKEVNAVLTTEQQAKLRVAMARANGPMAGAIRELELTPEQRTKVMPIVQKANEDIAKLNDDTSLKGKRKREKVQSIAKAAVTNIKTNGGLTDAQKTKLDAAAAKIGQRKNAAGGPKSANKRGAAVGAAK